MHFFLQLSRCDVYFNMKIFLPSYLPSMFIIFRIFSVYICNIGFFKHLLDGLSNLLTFFFFYIFPILRTFIFPDILKDRFCYSCRSFSDILFLFLALCLTFAQFSALLPSLSKIIIFYFCLEFMTRDPVFEI